MFLQWLAWYLALLVVALAVTPLALRLFGALPARGLFFARTLGILLVGYVLWIGFALGILSNDAGGAWISVLIVLAGSLWFGRREAAELRAGGWRKLEWRTILVSELLFGVAFALWAIVRAYDPAARHTEQPMDLMFMNSIWASHSFPPQDAWLSGYPISYYYFGYWLLVAMARLAGTPPAVAYNLGQAAWYGLLLSGAFGLAFSILRIPFGKANGALDKGAALGKGAAWLGGLLAAIAVGATSNFQGILEWLHAQGVNVDAIARVANVRGFPEGVPASNRWYIALGDWFWWRSSRVLADFGLDGGHQEVIAEYPAFSYILGDNHPHVLAMPFVILVIALILAWFLRAVPALADAARAPGASAESPSESPIDSQIGAPVEAQPAPELSWSRRLGFSLVAENGLLFAVTAVALGALLALNTWDFPPYLLLFGLVLFTTTRRIVPSITVPVLLAATGILLFIPYFLTAQSQADGFNVNFFNPTRLPQFLWVWMAFLIGVLVLYTLAWSDKSPRGSTLLLLAALTILAPLAFIALAWMLTQNSAGLLASLQAWMPLPEGASDYMTFIIERWSGGIWTLLLIALFLAGAGALWLARCEERATRTTGATFALLMTGVALLLVYAPEFIFLDDNFGWRMNTIFKFYYQAWLLLGVVSAVAITRAFAQMRRSPIPAILATPALALILFGVIFVVAGAYSRTNAFATQPTFDASAWVADYSAGQYDAAQWLRENARNDATIAEALGHSYQAQENIVSTLSGRPTLIGWEGHERQWRGNQAYGEMSAGRAEALETIYRYGDAQDVISTLDEFGIDYVILGPTERMQYNLSDFDIARLDSYLRRVFESGGTVIYARP